MDRRRFLRGGMALGGAAALSAALEACGRLSTPTPPMAATPTATPTATVPASTPSAAPSPTGQPTVTPPPRATVALVATTDRGEGVRRAIELAGASQVRGRAVLLKPNLNSADPAPGSTDRLVLEALVTSLVDLGAGPITVADRSGMGDTRAVMAQTGVFELSRSLGFDTVILDSLPDDAWQMVTVAGQHWSRGFPVPRLLTEAECVVATCNLKTHGHGGHFTISLKNSIGLVAKLHGGYNFMAELHDSPDQRRMIAEVNTAYAPALVVVDGVEAFVRGGPDTGTLAATGVVLAGTDRVAIDAVGVTILRLFGTTPEVSRGAVFEQEQIARAVELGLGVGGPDEIAFATPDAESAAYAERVRAELLA